jgi:salicylate hydroxylase
MKRATRVSVIGAGLGGICAAIALRQRGFDVAVFEQAAELGEVGAGIQLSPNAMLVLRALGLEDEFVAIAFEPDRHVVRNWKSGREVSATPMKGIYHAQYGAGYYGAHRADFHEVLRRALPAEHVKLNKKCAGVRLEKDRAVIAFADGSEIETDVVIGADGIHSKVRESLFGPESPRFTGNICWRGLVPVNKLPRGLISPDMNAWFGPNGSVINYYIRRGEMINWIAHFEEESWRDESWRVEVDWQEAAKAYEGWNPILGELFSHTERCYKWALYDRDPLPRWTKGRATLLGDSCHPMLPYLAQGACQAVEDGYVLADTLARYPDVEEALQVYERLRLDRTARVQLLARARSKINHYTSPLARLRRDIGYALQRLLNPTKHTYKIEWIYGHDVTAPHASDAREAKAGARQKVDA